MKMEPLPSTNMEIDLSIVTSPIHQLDVHKPFKDITVYSTTTQEREVHSKITTCIYTRQKSNGIQQKKMVITRFDEAVAPTHQIRSDPSSIGESKQEEGEPRKGTSTTQVPEHNPNKPTYKLI